MVATVGWLEKKKINWWRLLDDFSKRKAAKNKAHLEVTIRRLEKIKLTWWSQSEGWRKESSPGGHNQKVGKKKAHLVVTIRTEGWRKESSPGGHNQNRRLEKRKLPWWSP